MWDKIHSCPSVQKCNVKFNWCQYEQFALTNQVRAFIAGVVYKPSCNHREASPCHDSTRECCQGKPTEGILYYKDCNLEKILTVRLTLLNLIFCWTYKYIFAQNTTIEIVALGMDDNMDWRNNYSNQ